MGGVLTVLLAIPHPTLETARLVEEKAVGLMMAVRLIRSQWRLHTPRLQSDRIARCRVSWRSLCSSAEDPPDPPTSDSETSSVVPAPLKKPQDASDILTRRPKMVPANVPAIPLYRRPTFPGVIAPIVVQDSAACDEFIAMRDAGTRGVGLFLHTAVGSQPFGAGDGEEMSTTEPKKIHRVGVHAEIVRLAPHQKGLMLTFMCHHRIRWTDIVSESPLLVVAAEPVHEPEVDIHAQHIRAYSLEIVQTLKELLSAGPFYKEQLELLLETVDANNPYHLADLGACLTTAHPQALQAVLEEMDLEERLGKTLSLLKAELETIRVQRKINKQIEENVNKTQRKYFLTEQLKSIKKELGMERDEKETLMLKFRDRMKTKNPTEQIANVIDEESTKLCSLDPLSSEYNVTRNYLDWLTQIPWGVVSDDSLDVVRAEKILDEDHYGLADVKERILEFIAVGATKGSVQGKILLLSGPPGTGKTSIGKSIARALNREFYRFSVGGLGDVSEIKGHRRTYVGAMPGKLIQALKMTQKANPVIMIDEIDKMGRGYQGDPASALLETLDPEQNGAFMDHYLDVPVDLSGVLFVCTANVVDNIPIPLLDRMDSIRLSGYVLDEKVQIAKKYLVPQARKQSGVGRDMLIIRDSALKSLAKDYCREAGVRNLKNHVDKVMRKVALQRNRDAHKDDEPSEATVVSITNIETFAGKAPYSNERLFKKTPPGVAVGLAWTSMGGASLYIETVLIPGGTRGLKTTGQMGDVMKESTEIALSYATGYLAHMDSSSRFFETSSLHMHIPEGATPKDGPSAGITMITSLLSLATGRPITHNLAMTGEVTLTGKVLAVGGIREKVIAAKRSGVKALILPNANEKDWEELPDYIKKGIDVNFCEEYKQVAALAFAQEPAENQNGLQPAK